MSELFPDLLRAVISTTANVLLMMTLLQPKYSKKVTLLTMLGVLSADLGTAIYCYLSGNLTLLSKLDIVLFAILCFAVRPLFKDTFMQWLFSYLTVQNISDIVIILSFEVSRILPFPAYTNSLLRVILFGAFLFVLTRYVRPLYWQAVKHWSAYFAVSLGIYMTFNYYVLSTDDILAMLTEQAIPLLLVIFIGLAAYASIFLSLYNLQRDFQVKEENQKMQAEREYLASERPGVGKLLRVGILDFNGDVRLAGFCRLKDFPIGKNGNRRTAYGICRHSGRYGNGQVNILFGRQLLHNCLGRYLNCDGRLFQRIDCVSVRG